MGLNQQQRRAQAQTPSAPQPPALSNLRKMLAAGLRHHRAGRLAEAEPFYRQVLAVDARHPDALHLLGALAHQTGQNDSAVEIIGKAIVINPAIAAYHANLGTALKALGRLDEAVAAYEAAISCEPNFAEVHADLGNALQELGRLDEAVAAYNHAIRLRPDHAQAHANLGTALKTLGRLDDAVTAFHTAIGCKPDLVEAQSNLGNALKNLGRLDDAVASYRNAISCKPDFAEAHSNLGNALKELGCLDEAITAHHHAISCKPDFAEAHSNLGTALQELGRLDEAVAAYNTAIRLQPDFAEARSNLGNTLKTLGRLDEAIAAFNAAIACKPDYGNAHFNLGIGLLLSGDLSNGWIEYDWRWREGVKERKLQDLSKPQWRGEDLRGRTILLHAEQGLGDTIQFCRYAPLVAARGGRVVMEAPRALLRLLSGLAGVDRLIGTGEPLPAFDFHCPLMSLPTVFGTTLATIPATIPYLPVEEARRRHWQQRLSASAGRRVGIVWAGNREHKNDRNRSLPFAALAPLWNIPGIRWYSLQVGERRADLAAAPPGVIEDLSPALDDFAETAAALSQLDLVVTVDTSVAHLAGAIGRPTWVMLPSAPDWRWLTERADSPWYPSARLFRQTRRAAWGSVINDVASAITGAT